MPKTVMAALVAILAGTVLTSTAFAQASNVAGFDARLLNGKTCVGTFNTGSRSEQGKGGTILQFMIKNNALTANHWSGFGPTNFSKADAIVKTANASALSELTPNLSYIGELRDTKIAGNQITMTTANLAVYTLNYESSGLLLGIVDPRLNPERRTWTIAQVEMRCF